MLKRLLAKLGYEKKEEDVKIVPFAYVGQVMDITEIPEGEIMIFNGEDEWIGVRWEGGRIETILVPWFTVDKVRPPKPGYIVKAMPKGITKHETIRVPTSDSETGLTGKSN